MKKGIDISSWQPVNLDYNQLKENGVEFVIIRCGFTGDKDSHFEEHYNNCKKAGLKIGAYFYCYNENNNMGYSDANECLKYINGKQLDLPIFYDLEHPSIFANLTKREITKKAIEFCEVIKENGYQAGVYANLNWFTNYIDVFSLIDNSDKIWLAQWNDEYTKRFKIDVWQYTNNCDNLGIDGNYLINDSLIGNDIRYIIGNNYHLQDNMNVRTGAGTNFPVKKYDELTEDGKQHAFQQENAVLKKGTEVTCLDIIIDNKNNIWLKIPSGYVAGIYDGIKYIA